MNKVVLLTYTFSDADGTLIQSAQAATYFSPIGNELRAAQYKIPVIFVPRTQLETAENFSKITQYYYGAPVYIYEGKQQTRFFYLTAVTGGEKLPGGRYYFTLEGTDLAGLYASRAHQGGIYANTNAGDVIYSILGASGIQPGTGKIYYEFSGGGYVVPDVAIDSSLYSKKISGWLPYTNDARNNLRIILQRLNAVLTTMTLEPGVLAGQEGMIPYIAASQAQAVREISPYKTHAGDKYEQTQKIAKVNVLEHSYLALNSTDAEEIYDATGADHELVIFDQPYHSLDGGGLTINQQKANYAVVSGTGTLTGKPYVDAVRQLTETVGSVGGEITIDNTLIDSLNSEAMLERAANYYGAARSLRSDFAAEDELGAGSPVIVEDPLGEQVDGYIEEQTTTFSGINKHVNRIAAGWHPITGSVFTQMKILAEDGTLTVPDGATLMRLILIQGGKGGWGGYKGEDSHSPSFGAPPTENGEGGDVGEGGNAGKVLIVDVAQADLAASYAITVGAAGTPGAANHGEGTAGGHSSATGGGNTYTSSSGAIPTYGVANPMTGVLYAVTGPDGVYKGKDGGGDPLTDTLTGLTGNTTWRPGNNSSAGYGGGAAYGNNGDNAGRATGSGGDGADAVLDGFNGYTAPVGTYGSGGIGGNGGGGGGGHVNNAGSGGNGSPGGPGAQGVVIALFAFGSDPMPPTTQNWLYGFDGEQLFDFYYEPLKAEEE